MTNNNSSNNTNNSSNSESFDNKNLELVTNNSIQSEVEITACPEFIKDPVLKDESQWIRYTDYHNVVEIPYIERDLKLGHVGNFLFHGNQDTFLENKQASLESPQQECVYDSQGYLIDEDHKYSGMGGSTNYYSDGWDHTMIDPGGIYERGKEGFETSMEYYFNSITESASEVTSEFYKDSWFESTEKYIFDSNEFQDPALNFQDSFEEKNDIFFDSELNNSDDTFSNPEFDFSVSYENTTGGEQNNFSERNFQEEF